MVAYLSVINNPADTVRLNRIINEPKRGIGAATVAAAQQIALQTGNSLFDIFATADEYAALSRKAANVPHPGKDPDRGAAHRLCGRFLPGPLQPDVGGDSPGPSPSAGQAGRITSAAARNIPIG